MGMFLINLFWTSSVFLSSSILGVFVPTYILYLFVTQNTFWNFAYILLFGVLQDACENNAIMVSTFVYMVLFVLMSLKKHFILSDVRYTDRFYDLCFLFIIMLCKYSMLGFDVDCTLHSSNMLMQYCYAASTYMILIMLHNRIYERHHAKS